MKLSTCFAVAISCLMLSFWATAQTSPLNSEANSASVQIPHLIRFSGLAKDETGKPMSGLLGITFALYQGDQGGAPLWLETQNVQADGAGHYTALLGSATVDGVPLSLFSSAEVHWIGVQISGQPEQPRVLLLSVPYALKAADAETLGGLPASAFVQTGSSGAPGSTTTTPNAHASSNSAGKAAAPPATITGSGTTDFIPLWTSGTNLGNSILFQTGGNVGVATKTPGATLDTVGTAIAVRGTSSGTTGTGIFGSATNGSGPSAGVKGSAASISGIGVVGQATATSGNADGVRGTSASSSGIGVGGYATASTGSATGVYGGSSSSSGIGGLFQNTSKGKGAKIVVAEDGSGTQRFSVDTQGNVNVVTGTTTLVKVQLPVNHARTTVTALSGDNLFTLDWAFPFLDTSYTATCSYESTVPFESGSGVWGFEINSLSASSLVVDVASYGGKPVITIHCIGVHD